MGTRADTCPLEGGELAARRLRRAGRRKGRRPSRPGEKKYTKKKARAADDAKPEPLEDDTLIVSIEGETAEGTKVRKTAVILNKTGDVTAIRG
jgi:hypothetical protein